MTDKLDYVYSVSIVFISVSNLEKDVEIYVLYVWNLCFIIKILAKILLNCLLSVLPYWTHLPIRSILETVSSGRSNLDKGQTGGALRSSVWTNFIWQVNWLQVKYLTYKVTFEDTEVPAKGTLQILPANPWRHVILGLVVTVILTNGTAKSNNGEVKYTHPHISVEYTIRTRLQVIY